MNAVLASSLVLKQVTPACLVMPARMCIAQPNLVAYTTNGNLRDKDIILANDKDDMTDSSESMSPDSSPSTKSMEVNGFLKVPVATEALTKRPIRRKRHRMSKEERKVRHREIQRQFMKRKRARILELRKIQMGVEKQLRYVTMLQEIEQLKIENERLQAQYEACEHTKLPVSTKDVGNLVFSVPSQDLEVPDLELDDILDLFTHSSDHDSHMNYETWI